MKYFFFTGDGIGLSIANALRREGNEVRVGIVDDLKLTGSKEDEDPQKKERRTSLYDGMLDKTTAEELLKEMKKVPKDEKDNCFAFCDFNTLEYFGDKIITMGYKNVFVPGKYRHLEDDRNKAKDFVKKNYPMLKVAEVHDFKSVDDALQFLDESDELFVLKANGETDGKSLTVVPSGDNVTFNHAELKNALEDDKSEYESMGFILEKKIVPMWELTPEAMFWNGELIATTVDIENKGYGCANCGIQVGCAQNVVFKTDEEDKINDMAFPKAVHNMAKDHPGLFIWDASILYDGKDYYFGEFCANRLGWDSVFAEIAMAGSATKWIESIADGENPFRRNFGVSVRVNSQLTEHGKSQALKDVFINFDSDRESFERMFFYDIYKNSEKGYLTTGTGKELAVFTGASNDFVRAVDLAYECLENFSMGGSNYRPKFDFMSRDYQDSIVNRYEKFNHDLYEQEDIDD